MANPAMPLADPDATIVVGGDPDATIVVGDATQLVGQGPLSKGDPDATQVVSAPTVSRSAPVSTHTHTGGDATRVEFLRKVQARAKAKLKGADPTLAITTTVTTAPGAQVQAGDDGKRKKAFFSPVITRLVGRGLLSQRDAISASSIIIVSHHCN